MKFIFFDSGGPATIEFVASHAASSQASEVFSVAGVSFGAVASSRRVFLNVHWLAVNAASLLSATIGGVAATIHVQANYVAVGYSSAIISAPLATGTSGTVGLTFDAVGGTYTLDGLVSYRVTNLISAVAVDTDSFGANSGGLTLSRSIDVVEDGILISGLLQNSAATGFTVGGFTEDYDSNPSGSLRIVGGSLAVTADETARSISYTRTGGGGSTFDAAMVAASFR